MLNETIWNTFHREYIDAATTWLHQVREADHGWEKRVKAVYANGNERVIIGPSNISEETGVELFAKARARFTRFMPFQINGVE